MSNVKLRFGAPSIVRRATAVFAAAFVACAVSTAPAFAANGDGSDDPNLQQTIDENQEQGSGHVVLEEGHIDMGPTMGTGKFIMEVHDDTGDHSVWRKLSDVVIKVKDEALQEIPDDPTYSFIGATPGKKVWVIPQTQKQGVVWLGWNSQEPQLTRQINQGVTFSLVGVDGPGNATVFLQSGNFGAPEVLWSSTKPYPQDKFIEINSHTHANWTFTEPGSYQLRYRVTTTTLAGEKLETEDSLRIVVGSDSDAEEGFEQEWAGTDASAEATQTDTHSAKATVKSSNAASAKDNSDSSSMTPFMVGGAILVLVVLLICVVAYVVSGRKARQRVWNERQNSGGGTND